MWNCWMLELLIGRLKFFIWWKFGKKKKLVKMIKNINFNDIFDFAQEQGVKSVT